MTSTPSYDNATDGDFNNSAYDASCHGTSNEDLDVMVSLRIYFGASIFFVITGLVGNTLSMLVISSKEMQAVSSNVYLLTLAASDSSYLVSVFLSKTLTTIRAGTSSRRR